MIMRSRYINKLLAYRDTPLVKILTGVRRSGKSTIMGLLEKELLESGVNEANILHYNFDLLDYEGMTAKELHKEIRGKLMRGSKTYLFLDEIQEISNWEKVLNSLMIEGDVDIYVTGSNSRMMSSEISTYLTGRYVTFRVFPLSFEEYLQFRRSWTELKSLQEELVRYSKLGGFPALHLRDYSEDEAYLIVRDIYNSTVFTDIVMRNNIRKVDQLARVVRYVFDNVGNTFSASSIVKFLKSERRSLDNETIYNYLNRLECAYIAHRCSRFDLRGKAILKTQEKFYLADPALCYSILGYSASRSGGMLENIVYLELLRRGYQVYVGKLEGFEIDFVATRREQRIYVQVAQELSGGGTIDREYGRLLDIPDNYPKYVLSAYDFAGGNYRGIQTMNIADFLLAEDY